MKNRAKVSEAFTKQISQNIPQSILCMKGAEEGYYFIFSEKTAFAAPPEMFGVKCQKLQILSDRKNTKYKSKGSKPTADTTYSESM